MPDLHKITYEIPIFNAGSETIPAHAVVEVAGGMREWEGRDYIKVQKPSEDGQRYFLNGPFPIKAGKGGRATRDDGAYALCGDDVPADNETWGAVKDKWQIGSEGSGILVIGDPKGTSASEPGMPATASTKRVRVCFLSAGSTKTVEASVALIYASVGKAVVQSFNDGSSATPGILAADKTLRKGARMMTWNQTRTAYQPDTEIVVDGQPEEEIWADVVNLTTSRYRASEEDPILQFGYLETTTTTDTNPNTGEETTTNIRRFILPGTDRRSAYGWVKDQQQMIYHEADDDEFQAGGEDCN